MRRIKYLFPGLRLVVLSLMLACEFNPLQPGRPNSVPEITFFEGNDAAQDVVCSLRISTQTVDSFVYDFTSHPDCENDEARSLVLHDVSAGVTVCIYDDSDCTLDDSASRIVVKRDLTTTIIGSFEFEVISDEIDVILLRGGNLDGKVSCVVVGYAECP